jgi:hypothetical protein
MYTRFVNDPEQVISRIRFESSDDPQLADLEEKWKTAFLRFLRGRGRPGHDLLPTDLSDIERNEDVDHSCYRAVRFLSYVTGSEMLPEHETDNIMVKSSLLSILLSSNADLIFDSWCSVRISPLASALLSHKTRHQDSVQ